MNVALGNTALPNTNIEDALSSNNEQVTCVICLSNVQRKIFVTKCKHQYHKICLNQWAIKGNQKNCPVCRRNLSQRDLFKLQTKADKIFPYVEHSFDTLSKIGFIIGLIPFCVMFTDLLMKLFGYLDGLGLTMA